jgi:small conductance mechanosensitive channel
MSWILTPAFWQTLYQDALQGAAARGMKILVIVLVYWMARQLLFRVIDLSLSRVALGRARPAEAEEERVNRLRTLQGLVKSIVAYLLTFVLAVMVLDALGVNVSGIIATAGIGGIAIGIGANKLTRDMLSGFFLIIEDQFAVGDYVTIGTASGVVEEMSMRVTRLRDDQGRIWMLSNGDISTVINHSRTQVESYVDVGIASSADLQRAAEAINQTGEELLREEGSLLKGAPRVLGVSAFDAAKIVLRVEVLADPQNLPAAQMRVREAVHLRLRQEGIPPG